MGIGARLRTIGSPRTAWVLTATTLLIAVGFGVVIPVLSPFARISGTDSFQLGLVVFMFIPVWLINSPFVTRIRWAMGERNAITLEMVIVATTTFGVALSPSLAWMITVRAFGGIGSAMFTIAAMDLLIPTTPQHLRGRASGLNRGGFLLDNMAGPAIGGLLGLISLHAPFYFYPGILLMAGLFVLLLLPAEYNPLPATAKESLTFRETSRDARYRAACLLGSAQGWQSIRVRAALIPVIITEIYTLETGWTGMAFTIAAVSQAAALTPIGLTTDRISRKPVMVTNGLVCNLLAIAMPFAPRIWVLIPLLYLYEISVAIQGTTPAATVGDASGGHGGTPVVAYSMIIDPGTTIGPVIVSRLADVTSYQAGFAAGGALLLLDSPTTSLIPQKLDWSFLNLPAPEGDDS